MAVWAASSAPAPEKRERELRGVICIYKHASSRNLSLRCCVFFSFLKPDTAK